MTKQKISLPETLTQSTYRPVWNRPYGILRNVGLKKSGNQAKQEISAGGCLRLSGQFMVTKLPVDF